jgi:CTP synthase (UTP-ammonia lyase)
MGLMIAGDYQGTTTQLIPHSAGESKNSLKAFWLHTSVSQ